MKRIVVGIDPASDTDSLIEWIAGFADDLGARVDLAYVVPRATLWMVSGARGDSNEYLRALRSYFERHVVERLHAQGIAANVQILCGDPAKELSLLARRVGADLIAIGGADHCALHDIVFGGFAHRLEHHSDVPVVVIPLENPTKHPV